MIWDERFSQEGFAYGLEPNDFLRENVSSLPQGGKILCLGEGEGRNAFFLLKQGFKVSAVDQSKVGGAKACALAFEYGYELRYKIADLETYDLGNSCWDGIVSIFCHTPKVWRKGLHARIIQALRPGGVFLSEGYSLEQLQYQTGGPKSPDLLYSRDEFEKDFTSLEKLFLVQKERPILEGRYHTGKSSVVQCLLRK